MAAIDKIPYRRGSTDTAAGIKTALEDVFVRKRGDRSDVPNIMIILTDGGSDIPEETAKQAKKAHEEDIR